METYTLAQIALYALSTLRANPHPAGPGGSYVRYDGAVVVEVLHVYRTAQPALEAYWVEQKRETRARRRRWQREAREAEARVAERRAQVQARVVQPPLEVTRASRRSRPEEAGAFDVQHIFLNGYMGVPGCRWVAPGVDPLRSRWTH